MLTETIEKCIVSVNMSKIYADSRAITKWTKEFRGVFTIADLRNLLVPASDVSLFRRLKTLRSHGVLRKFSRCFYVAEDFDLEALSARISDESCISFGNVLARSLIIGSIPVNRVMAVKCGRSRQYLSSIGSVEHLRIAPHLMYGYYFRDGIRYADNEKALLDTLYYLRKGRRFSFDVHRDVDFERLDQGRIAEYLERYRDRGFVSYARKIINA